MVSLHLRLNYLDTIKDGVGERLITLPNAFLQSSGYRTVSWRANAQHIKRTHSPPIPTAIASEYFQAPSRIAGLSSSLNDDDAEEGGMVTGGGGAGDTIGLGIATKRRRRKEQMEEEDSSDLSDESDDDDQRAAQAIKFTKMPIRTRSGSSPIRGSHTRTTGAVTSPIQTTNAHLRRGSQSAVDIFKERARRDTVTSSEMSSENDFDTRAYKRSQTMKEDVQRAGSAGNATTTPTATLQREQSEALEEEDEDFDGSDLSSAFAGSVDSTSMLNSVDAGVSLLSSSIPHIAGNIPQKPSKSLPKKSKQAPQLLQALPPPRPISTIQPKSLLGAALRANKSKAANPFEAFAAFSGQGDPNPLRLRIWVPFVHGAEKYYEVLISRLVHGGDSGERQPTVADLIGLSLWKYLQGKLSPSLELGHQNVNRWTLRLVEDEEVDYDFPALDRSKPIAQFTTANNRAARSRSASKPFDEFGLVEATDAQFKENQTITPQFQQAETVQAVEEDITPRPTPSLQPVVMPSITQPKNLLLLNKLTVGGSSVALADTPVPVVQSTIRSGVKKLLRVHILSTDSASGQMITVEATTDTYMADVLDMACKKRQLDKANYVLKLSGSSAVVYLDRTVSSIGNHTDLDLDRRRFATDGSLTMAGSPSGTSPRSAMLLESAKQRKLKLATSTIHPLARKSSTINEVGSADFMKKYTVWRKQPMRFVAMNERVIGFDGEYLHIMPGSNGKNVFDQGQGKTTTAHFSNVIGCKVARRHPTHFKVVIFRNGEQKRFDFESKNMLEAKEIVEEVQRGINLYHA